VARAAPRSSRFDHSGTRADDGGPGRWYDLARPSHPPRRTPPFCVRVPEMDTSGERLIRCPVLGSWVPDWFESGGLWLDRSGGSALDCRTGPVPFDHSAPRLGPNGLRRRYAWRRRSTAPAMRARAVRMGQPSHSQRVHPATPSTTVSPGALQSASRGRVPTQSWAGPSLQNLGLARVGARAGILPAT
jgi:hypothetical protein